MEKLNERIIVSKSIDLLDNGDFKVNGLEIKNNWTIIYHGTWILHPNLCKNEKEIERLKELYNLEEYDDYGDIGYTCECSIYADIDEKYENQNNQSWEEFLEDKTIEDIMNFGWSNYTLE